jgi:hypothetical protein
MQRRLIDIKIPDLGYHVISPDSEYRENVYHDLAPEITRICLSRMPRVLVQSQQTEAVSSLTLYHNSDVFLPFL